MTVDGHTLSMILDGAVIVLLAAVIFFASRLSLYLRDFRAGRKEMERLVRELSFGVERADRAMAGMREAARESGRDLQALINQASALSEELQMVSDAGNSMARRLETVAEKSGRRAAPASGRGQQGFSIRDPEFNSSPGDDADDGSFMAEDDASGLQSRAERELFDALQGSQRKKARV